MTAQRPNLISDYSVRLSQVFSALLLLLVALQVSCSNQSSSQEKPETNSKEESAKIVHHSIDYIEFSVTNMEEAKKFYGAAFDWKFNDYGPDYAGIKRRNGEAGGFAVVDKVVAGGPLVVLYSKDLDATLEKVKTARGKITKEPFSFPGGRRFHFQDPSGNQLAVWAHK